MLRFLNCLFEKYARENYISYVPLLQVFFTMWETTLLNTDKLWEWIVL